MAHHAYGLPQSVTVELAGHFKGGAVDLVGGSSIVAEVLGGGRDVSQLPYGVNLSAVESV